MKTGGAVDTALETALETTFETALIPELGTCPRCGGPFVCGAAGPEPCPCPCAGLTLSTALQAALRARYAGCLCLVCLRELALTDTRPGAVSPAAPAD